MKSIFLQKLTNINTISQYIRIAQQHIKFNDEVVFAVEENSLEFLSQAYKHFEISYPKFYKMDLLSKVGFLASEILLKNISLQNTNAFKKGILFQNTNASLETDKNYQETISSHPSPALFVYTLPNIVMGEIAIRQGFKGENTFLVSEKMNASQLVNYATILLNENIVEQLLLGYIEINETSQDVLICLVNKNGELPLTIENLQNLYDKK